MFEVLSDKLNKVFQLLGNKGRLSEKDMDEALRHIRLALLEADVHFKVVKEFTAAVRQRALTAQVLEHLAPAQQIVKIVNEELIAVLGGGQSQLVQATKPPSIAMLVGLQGSGKTTTTAKLALHLRHSGQRPLMVAADTRRPAAMEQLATLARQLGIPFYQGTQATSPLDICRAALGEAKRIEANWILIDTAGRLHIDEALMQELNQLRAVLQPCEVLLVVDAMTGQDAVRVAEEFNSAVRVTGLILTKMDGDARGGAALSIRSVTGIPIKFIGNGEKPDALEAFHPDRLASRILGMGDVLTLIEKAERVVDEEKARALEKKVRTATFDLEDFLEQLGQIKKMGSLAQLAEMVPGLSKLTRKLPGEIEEKRLKRIEAIICSMTPGERHNPHVIDGSRRRRIALGSGTTAQEINQLLNQFQQMQKLFKSLPRGKMLGGLPNIFK